jgi:predicted MPP superfamily phosphohydrolase
MHAGRRHDAPHHPPSVSVRRAVVATAIVFGWSLLVGGYAWLGEPGWIEVSHHTVGAPVAGQRPFRIVQLADLHLQRLGARERRVAEAVREAHPDLLVLGGDVIDHPEGLPVLDALLLLIGERKATVAVLGNWELWSGVERQSLQEALAHRGGRLLANETLRLQHEGRTIAVVGLDDATTGHADPKRATADALGVPNVVALTHSPLAREEWSGPPPTFMLAAHTHGGQVAFLGYAPARPAGSGRYVAGWYRDAPFDMYVSRGIGTSVLPIRFGARPEVAVFDWWLK